MQLLRLLLLSSAACVLLAGCVSTSAAPTRLSPSTCIIDAGLPGTWRSTRLSQFGPASMTFQFNCDCTYVAKTRLLFKIIREKGAYWVLDGQLSLSRASGEASTWSFRFDGDQLLLEEHEDEVHAYARKAVRSCG